MRFLEFRTVVCTAKPRALANECSFQRMVGVTELITVVSKPNIAGMMVDECLPQCPAGALAIVVGFRHEGR